MEVTLQMYLIVCPLVFLAAVIDSIGGGGGLISLPAYMVAGLPPVLAAGTNKFSACFGTMVSTAKYFKSGKLLLKPSLFAVVGALPGAYIGAEVLKHTPEQFVRIFMLVAIPVVALVMVFRRDKEADLKPITGRSLAYCLLIGLACGFYDGFFGPGTGTILIMLFHWLAGMDMVTASGTAKPVNLASNVAALTSMVISGHVLYLLAVPAMFCSIAGNYLGTHLALTRGAKLIRYVMLLVLAILIGKMIVEMVA